MLVRKKESSHIGDMYILPYGILTYNIFYICFIRTAKYLCINKCPDMLQDNFDMSENLNSTLLTFATKPVIFG